MGSTADIKNNVVIEFNGGLWKVVEFLHVKPGKGNAFIRTKIKNIPGGKVIDHTFRSGEKVEYVRLDAREMTYLYRDGDHYYFMDSKTFDQIPIDADLLKGVIPYMKENDPAKLLFNGDVPVDVELPAHAVLEITQTDPGLKGDTATGGSKPATCETGLLVTVPLFLNEGDKIRVDTRTGGYLERVRD
jgi:elongation factor P